MEPHSYHAAGLYRSRPGAQAEEDAAEDPVLLLRVPDHHAARADLLRQQLRPAGAAIMRDMESWICLVLCLFLYSRIAHAAVTIPAN